MPARSTTVWTGPQRRRKPRSPERGPRARLLIGAARRLLDQTAGPSVPGSAQRSEGRAELFREELRLLPGGEVAAPVDFVEVDELGIRPLGPAPRRLVLLTGEDRHGHRNRHALLVEEAALVFPVEPRRGDP